MIVRKTGDTMKSKVQMEGVKNTWIRWLIGEDSNAPNFYLRLFELEPGGHTPYHTHPWEHEIYVLEGHGQLNTEDESHPLEENTFALIHPNETHQFENTGPGNFKFLCVIPKEGK